MATVITAGNATNGLTFTSDNTGSLDIKTGTGAGTTALTLTSSQIATFAGAASVPGNLSFNSGYGSAAVAYGCRAWVNFNGTGTVAIRASGNVTSITDNGVGDYTVNFTTALVDANYSCCFGLGNPPTSNFAYSFGATTYTPTTTSHRFQTVASNTNNTDLSQINLSYFR